MKYDNAKDLLPEVLLKEVQKYAAGKLLYIPVDTDAKNWGEVSGYRQQLLKRNLMICNKYAQGTTVSELADEYYLSLDSIKKIIYSKKDAALVFSATVTSAAHYANAGMLEEWLQSYFMSGTDVEKPGTLDENSPILYGLAMTPLRLIETSGTQHNSGIAVHDGFCSYDETAPLILRFYQKRFYADKQTDLFLSLKNRRINAYPAIILCDTVEAHKVFMSNFGRHFLSFRHTKN